MHRFRFHIDFESWYQKLIAPHSLTPDQQRRELLLNILLCGLCGIAIVADLLTISNHLSGSAAGRGNSLPALLIFTLVIMGLWRLSRRGYYRFSALVLVGFLLLGALQLIITWSYELPSAELVLALVITIAGVLLAARTALVVSLVVAAGLLIISYLQTYGYIHPDLKWANVQLEMSDAVGYAILLLVVGLVSWLANRETDRSLARARASEGALELERDNLEIKVIERTRELEQAQLVRVMELQRLAEFGRLSAGLLHEMANPLTVASLNLEQHTTEPRPVLLRRAVQSLQHIERFVDAARKQLKGQGNLATFSLQQEIKQVMRIMNHRARESGVKLELVNGSHIRLFGDPVKFNQLIANLLINSIEAYDDQPTPFGERRVVITLKQTKKSCLVQVQDWGQGLSVDEKKQIFEPFYSTKRQHQQNMGIGLAMVQQIVTTDFGGTVSVTSSPKRGTCFTVSLRSQDKPQS